MTTPSLFALQQTPGGIRPPSARTGKDDAEAGALWACIAEASGDEAQTEGQTSIDATTADATTTDATTAVDPVATDTPPARSDVPAPGAAPFDLPAFLQVLPKAGTAVAVAAGRDPAMAEAVRRLPVREMPDGTAVSSRPVGLQQGASLRLPAFLVPVNEGAGRNSTTASGAMRGTAQNAALPNEVVPNQVVPNQAQFDTVAALRGAVQSLLPNRPTGVGPASSTTTGTVGNGKIARTVSAPATSGEGAHNAGEIPKTAFVDARSLESLRAADRRIAEPRPPKLGGGPVATDNPLTAAAPTTQSVTTPVTAAVAFDLSGLAGLSAASLTMASDPSAAAGDSSAADGLLRTPVGSEGWQDELRAQLAVMSSSGTESEAVMKLAPEELGELEIRVQIRDGEASLQFGALNAEARQAIEAAQPRLRELFASQGMGVSNFSVFSSLSGNPQSSSKQGEGSSRSPRSGASLREDIEVRVAGRASQGILDLYA